MLLGDIDSSIELLIIGLWYPKNQKSDVFALKTRNLKLNINAIETKYFCLSICKTHNLDEIEN